MKVNVLDIFEKVTLKYSKKIAVRDNNTECTFADLRTNAMTVGSNLLNQVSPGSMIPVYMEKGVATLQIFLGIVYAGGYYSLLNPIQPKSRTERILEIIDVPLVVTDKEHYFMVKEMSYSGEIVLAEDLLKGDVKEELLANIRAKMIDSDPLYVNFTSGSTGIPKGVVISHRSVIDFIQNFVNIFNIESGDIIGNQAPFDFDVSVKDIYSALFTGATLYIIPREYFAYPKKLLDALGEQKVSTLIWAVSALCSITSLNAFTYKIPRTVNKVLFSGEVMPVKHLIKWQCALPDAMFVNLYGPTEVTCNCTYYILDKKVPENQSIPIGKPFPNERVILLDESNCVINKSGVKGEICVAGSALALGYYRDTKRTDEVFVQNPLNDKYSELLYRTGDMAFYCSDGNLVYAGRKDFQIKHMGYRIELGEVEANIDAISGVERTCCIYDEEKKRLIAFYVGSAEDSCIRTELRKNLIKYMIPQKFVQVESMPLTKNGKIDRAKLKEMI